MIDMYKTCSSIQHDGTILMKITSQPFLNNPMNCKIVFVIL